MANKMMEALKKANEQAEKAGISDMTLDEINAEIALARNERKIQKMPIL